MMYSSYYRTRMDGALSAIIPDLSFNGNCKVRGNHWLSISGVYVFIHVKNVTTLFQYHQYGHVSSVSRSFSQRPFPLTRWRKIYQENGQPMRHVLTVYSG